MQTYVCKCGKTFEKSTKAETTGYELHNYSPQHECYGCPYIVIDRSWQTNEIVKRECRATPKITYLSKCHIGTGKGDFTACKVYSLDLTFVKRVMNYVNSLDGAETGNRLNRIPGEWRAADFGICYSPDNCFGLAIFNLYFKNNKAGTAARKLVKERFFSESGVRKDMTEEKERETVLMRIQIAKENAKKALVRNTGEPTEADIALFEQYEEHYGISCRFWKVFGFDDKYAKQHRDKAHELYNEIVSKGLEQAYKKWREMKRNGSQQSMCGTCANNDGNCLKPAEGECIRYVSTSEAAAYLNTDNADKIEEDKMTPNFNFKGFISEGNQLKQVPLDMLVPYHNHKFKLYEGERLEDMVNSIKDNGVLTPIIVRNMGGEHYEILAGHNRTNAARLAGLSVIPAIVKENLSDDEAEMYVIETNVMQRGFNDLSISERAAVVAARHSAMFDEDKRRAIERELTILNGDTPVDEVEEPENGEKKSKLAAVGENYGLSKDSVARLIRINTLDDQLKTFIDEGDVSVRAGVNLSYLLPNEQKLLIKVMLECVNTKISMQQAELLRELSHQSKFIEKNVNEVVLCGKLIDHSAPAPRKPIKVKISADISAKYFPPNLGEDKVREIVELALERYFANPNNLIMDDNDEYQI